MRTTMNIRDHLLRAAKRRAAEQNRTLTSLVEEGLQAVLSGQPKQPDERHVALPVSTATGGTLPGVDLTRSTELEELMSTS